MCSVSILLLFLSPTLSTLLLPVWVTSHWRWFRTVCQYLAMWGQAVIFHCFSCKTVSSRVWVLFLLLSYGLPEGRILALSSVPRASRLRHQRPVKEAASFLWEVLQDDSLLGFSTTHFCTPVWIFHSLYFNFNVFPSLKWHCRTFLP